MKSQIHECQKKSKKLMNKILKTIALTILLCYTANAQITKGNWMVGGDAYFSNVTNKNANGEKVQSSSQLRLGPNLGYFFYDRFAAGLSTALGFTTINGSNNINSGFGLGPFIRYYFLKPEKTVNFLLQANYNYGKSFNNSDFTTSYGLKLGPVIYFNSSVGLELLAKYEHFYISSDSRTANIFQIGIGLQIHLEKE